MRLQNKTELVVGRGGEWGGEGGGGISPVSLDLLLRDESMANLHSIEMQDKDKQGLCEFYKTWQHVLTAHIHAI